MFKLYTYNSNSLYVDPGQAVAECILKGMEVASIFFNHYIFYFSSYDIAINIAIF